MQTLKHLILTLFYTFFDETMDIIDDWLFLTFLCLVCYPEKSRFLTQICLLSHRICQFGALFHINCIVIIIYLELVRRFIHK